MNNKFDVPAMLFRPAPSWCYDMPCHAMPCHATPCHATPCNPMPYPPVVSCALLYSPVLSSSPPYYTVLYDTLPTLSYTTVLFVHDECGLKECGINKKKQEETKLPTHVVVICWVVKHCSTQIPARLLAKTGCGLSNHQAAAAQMHLVEKRQQKVECRPPL